MDMENDHHHTQIIKGKRTKRQRTSSPSSAAVASTSSSSGTVAGAGEDPASDRYFSIPCPTTSGDSTTDEDEDMANCLILLAQSCNEKANQHVAGDTSGAGAGVYECRTCNRNFTTFQALGGHRASHKKPRAQSPAPPVLDQNRRNQLEDKYVKIIEPINKVHECSICGSQFSSGQALGGHMRRHRTPASTPVTINSDLSSGELFCESENKQRKSNILGFDLNLPPATEEDRRDLEFPFTPNNTHLVLSATALVGCNY